jgi:hypothetical protein
MQITRMSAIFVGVILIGSYWYTGNPALPAAGIMCIGWACGIFGAPSAVFHWTIPWLDAWRPYHHWHK